jgi:ParB family chromosome partitioning protein
MTLATIPISRIEPGTRLRQPDEEQVARLADSIAEVGLLNPITVYPRNVIEAGIAVDGYGVVAGLHRLEACRKLGLADIEANIVDLPDLKRQLAECDENLCGTKLTPSERALFTRRRKEIYEALHPETRQRANVGPNRQFVATETPAFTADTATRTGVDRRTVERDARRGDKVDAEIMAEIRGTDLDKGVVLDALASLPRDLQRERLNEFRSGQRHNAAYDKMTREDAAERLAELLSEHVPGEHWTALTALLYASGCRDVGRVFTRLNGLPVFDNTRAA